MKKEKSKWKQKILYPEIIGNEKDDGKKKESCKVQLIMMMII